jgi:3-oxoacyl-[acyl-carrier protein] reductase
MRLSGSGFGLEGKTAIITGSARNISKAVAVELARFGAKVVINGHRDTEKMQQTVKEITDAGGKAIAIRADISKLEDVSRTLENRRRSR